MVKSLHPFFFFWSHYTSLDQWRRQELALVLKPHTPVCLQDFMVLGGGGRLKGVSSSDPPHSHLYFLHLCY